MQYYMQECYVKGQRKPFLRLKESILRESCHVSPFALMHKHHLYEILKSKYSTMNPRDAESAVLRASVTGNLKVFFSLLVTSASIQICTQSQ